MMGTKNSLTINGKTFNYSELISCCNSQLNSAKKDWEYDMFRFIKQWIDNNDFIEVHTSGSTGTPKVLQLLKKDMTVSAKRTGHFLNLKKGDKVLLCLSTNYIAGKMMIVRAFVLQLNLISIPINHHPFQYLDTHIHMAAVVPLQLTDAIQYKKQLNLIDKVIIGGGEVTKELKMKLQDFKTHFFETFGMTETCSHVAIKQINGEEKSDYFKVLRGIHISKDSQNCLCIKDSLTQKYFTTNDIVEIKNNKCFEWIGRKDNTINSGGIKLIPELLEAKIHNLVAHPFIICGIPDKRLTEKAVLILEDQQWEQGVKQDVLKKINSPLSKYEWLKDILFIKEFPLTPTNKVDRKRIKMIVTKVN